MTAMTCGLGFVVSGISNTGLRRCGLGFRTACDSVGDPVSLTDVRLEAEDRVGECVCGLVLSLEESVALKDTCGSDVCRIGIAARTFWRFE